MTITRKADVFAAAGIFGAVQPARFVGATTTGPPTVGTFEAGDFIVDRKGRLHVCYVAGTPGSWRSCSSTFQNWGVLATAEQWATTAVMGAANRALYARVMGSGPISKLVVAVSNQSGNICGGVYRNSGDGATAVPTTRIATSGSVAAVNGKQALDLGATVEVNEGDWFAISADNNTVTFRSPNSMIDASMNVGRATWEPTAFPLPATATPQAGGIDRIIHVVGLP